MIRRYEIDDIVDDIQVLLLTTKEQDIVIDRDMLGKIERIITKQQNILHSMNIKELE